MQLINAQIKDPEVRFCDHAGLVAGFTLSGKGWGCGFGYSHVQREGMHDLMRGIMECVGVESWSQLNGVYVRVEDAGPGSQIKRITHILDDARYFDTAEWAAKAEKLNPASGD